MRAHALFGIVAAVCLLATAVWADIYCPACGIRYPDSFHYCPKDGTDLDQARAEMEKGTDPVTSVHQPKPRAARPTIPAKGPAAPSSRTPALSSDWAKELPIHLPAEYPDANLGDFALLDWVSPKSKDIVIFLRVVLKKGKGGHISVLASTQAWPKPKAGSPPPSLDKALARVNAENSYRFEWYDYRDYANSFRIRGQQLLSPFVGGMTVLRQYEMAYVVNRGRVNCDVFEYLTRRNDNSYVHMIKTSQLVPYSFVESTYKDLGERLRVYLFGTVAETELARLQKAFPPTTQ